MYNSMSVAADEYKQQIAIYSAYLCSYNAAAVAAVAPSVTVSSATATKEFRCHRTE